MKALLLEICLAGALLTLTACGVKNDSGDVRNLANGPLPAGLKLADGWQYEGKVIDSSLGHNLADASAVVLPDKRVRIYSNEDTGTPGLRRVISFVSSDGLHFERETGVRLENQYAFTPYVMLLPDGRFRMYMTDQTKYVGERGAIDIKSAISNDGLNFVMEPGDRLKYLASGDEAGGIRGSNVVRLSDGTYRMFYGGLSPIGNEVVSKSLSASSPDGLNFTRDAAERINRQSITPLANAGFGNPKPYLDSKGTLHLFMPEAQSDSLDHKNEIFGIFDETSTDGLNFSHSRTPVVQSFFLKKYYRGNPVTDPFVGVEDQMVVPTPGGLRMYFFIYGATGGAPWNETGIFSVINPNLR